MSEQYFTVPKVILLVEQKTSLNTFMFIMGTTITNWIRLLRDHGFRFSIKRLHKVIIITLVIVMMTPFSMIERLIIHPRVRKVSLAYPPIFILGHWRSGTTHLQNMFTKDMRFCYPNMVDTIWPNHMILSRWLLRPFMSIVLPDKRPMDDMELNVDVPGEQDWAISNLCLMTPYSGAYFPNEMYSRYRTMTNFEEATSLQRKIFVENLKFYLQKLQYKYPRRQIVLKSPMDTTRAKLLFETFPKAKFVHIYRNPYEVFYSTKKLHIKNMEIYPLQEDKRDLEEFIFKTYSEMFDIYLSEKWMIPKNQLIEIAYETLIHDRISTMKEIYNYLELPDFDGVMDDLRLYVESLRGYQVDEYIIDRSDRDRIYNRLHRNIDLWGYEVKVHEKKRGQFEEEYGKEVARV